MDIKKVTLTRYSIIVNGADVKKAIKPMQNASVESMFIDVFDDKSAVICCESFKDVRNCLAILKETGCSSAIVNLERVYNECNSTIIKSVAINFIKDGIKTCAKGKEYIMKNAIEKLKEYGVGSYAIEKWYELKEYKTLFGFLTAMESVAILKDDSDGERVFHEAAVICLNKIYNKGYNYD